MDDITYLIYIKKKIVASFHNILFIVLAAD